MFWFIYKKYIENNGLVYSWVYDRATYDISEARYWHSKTKDREQLEIRINKLGRDNVFKLPAGEGEIITDQFREFLLRGAREKSLDDITFSFWIDVIKKYDVLDDNWLVVFAKNHQTDRDDTILPDMGLLLMKMFMEGFYRFSPIKYKPKETSDFITVPIGQDYNNKNVITYRYKGVEYSTPLYGCYAPSVWTAMFADQRDFGWGRVLQARQLNAMMNLGRITYIASARRSGKSWLLALIWAIMSMKEGFSLSERGRAVKVNFIWLTDEANETVVEYILDMSKKMMNDRLFKWKWKSKVLEFYDGDFVVGRVKFISAEGKVKGRGTYADLIVLDEAAYMDFSIYKTNLPIVLNQGAMMVCISTIDPLTKKNRFYRKLTEAESEQLSYAPIEDQIVTLRKKYEMDKVDGRKEIKSSKLVQMKKEIRSLRKNVWLRYTLDDIEYMTPNEKKEAKQEAIKEWLAFYYAEWYSMFLDESSVFNAQWCIVNQDTLIDMKYDSIILWFDTATQLDNPALCIVGTNKKTAYVLECIILPKDDVDEQVKIIQLKRSQYKNMLKIYDHASELPLVVDCTSAPQHTLQNLELRGLSVTMPIQYTPWSIKKRNGRFHLVPKEVLVKEAQEFFKGDNIQISTACNNKNGLVNELDNFQVKALPWRKDRYEAISWHDDQVNAMMMALGYIYTFEGFNVTIAEDDANSKLSFEEYLQKYNEEKKQKTQVSGINAIMQKYWF